MGHGRRKPPQDSQNSSQSAPRRQHRAGSSRRRGSRDPFVLFFLLVVIASLLVALITLLPKDAPRPSAGQAETDPGAATGIGTVAESQPEAAGGAGQEPALPEGATEYYPEDESGPSAAASPTEGDLWWLPDPPPGRASPGRLYFVLDDAGNSTENLDSFLSLPMPLTIAVLPQREYSVVTALLAVGAGKEVILHQPMEALDGTNPGAGVVDSSLTDAEITEAIGVNLDSVPGAAGLNNHMGSRTTQDARVMRLVMQEAKRRGLYFLDSRTTSDSVAASVAGEVRLPFAERHVFLDNSRTRDDILSALSGALQLAYRQDDVVVIGHLTHPLVAQLLAEVYPVLVDRGFTFGLLSELFPQ